MSKKSISRIRSIKDYQKKYIEQVKNAVETVPMVEKNIEWADWAEKSVIKSEEEGSNLFSSVEFDKSLSLIEDSIKDVLPNLSIDPQVVGGTIGSANATLSAVVFDRINGGANNLGNNTGWITPLNKEYYSLQSKHNDVDEIANLLKGTGLKEEFLKAVDKYSKVTSDISSYEEAAIIMRNVIEGLKGYLFEEVRKNSKTSQSKENLKWDHISNNLAIGGVGSNQSILLLSKKEILEDIHSNLGNIAKNTGSDLKSLLQTYYSKWLNFLYTTLSLIDPKYLNNYSD